MQFFKSNVIKLGLIVLMMVFPTQVHAATSNDIHVSLDGKIIGQGYLSKENHTMIPLRVLSETLNYKVQWDNSTDTAIISNSDTTIKIITDYHLAKINDDYLQLTATPTMKNGTTYVPLRFIIEAMGLHVSYADQTAYISTTGEKPALPAGKRITFEEVPSYLLGNGYELGNGPRGYYKLSYGEDGFPYTSSFGQVHPHMKLMTIGFGDNSPEGLAFIKDFLQRFVPSSADEIYTIISTQSVIPLQIMESDNMKIAFEASENSSLFFTFDGTPEETFIQNIINGQQ